MRQLRSFAFLLLVVATPCQAAAPDPLQRPWQALTRLVGTWVIAAPKTPREKAFRVSYRLISGDTALVETYGDPAGRVTQTIFHRDGQRLLATHYCAQGNQPRLRMSDSSADGVVAFEFMDATNLDDAGDSHLVRLRLQPLENQRLLRSEVYSADGVEHEATLELRKTD